MIFYQLVRNYIYRNRLRQYAGKTCKEFYHFIREQFMQILGSKYGKTPLYVTIGDASGSKGLVRTAR